MTIYLLIAFLLSMICGLIFTPLILDFCKRKKLYDIPNERKVHKNAVPRLGGLSFFPSMMMAFVIVLVFFSFNRQGDIPIKTWSMSFITGLAIIYLIGIIDDLIGLNASSKFMAQIATACLLPISGLYINNLYGLFGIYELPYAVGILLTIFIIVFIDNAINLIDGIDGLAGSLSLLALGGFLAYFVHNDVFVHTYNILVAGMMGALVTFLYFNIFGRTERNTKIFMGDSGSLSLGFTLGFLSIKCMMNNIAVWPERSDALLVPISLLFVPTADVVRVTLHRLRHCSPLFLADKNHIHHKLMRAGLSQHQALAAILVMAIAVILLNWLLFPTLNTLWIVAIDTAIYCLINVCINQWIDSNYLKRAFDVVLSCMCLILFSPLILICYLIIKIGGGPAIYKQERIGKGGRPFYIYKFRSMKVDAEKEGEELLQLDNDPRMTKTGRILRSHHLDELPQLWNVLCGDMSFVGPRPERKYYIDQIMERDSRYEKLYALRPGVTSYATLKNGYTDTIDKMLVRLEMDLYYLEHQSLWTDIKILMKTFGNIASGRIFCIAFAILCANNLQAQDSLQTRITYDLTTEAAVGTGDFTAYQLTTNRHHVLATRPNTAYLRGAVNIEHAFNENWKLSGAIDAIGSLHADHKAYLQQCYANLSWKQFFLEVGSREQEMVVRDNLLSVGSFVNGINAKPIPQIHVGTKGFWNVPFTKGWVQINIDFGYGKFLDNSYREKQYFDHQDVSYQYATGAYYHHKHLYIRSNPEKPVFITVGINHVAQFGGTNNDYRTGTLITKSKPANFKAFWKVIFPTGDSNYFENESLEDWVYGNHLGLLTYQIGWNINKNHQVQAYLDNPFEDGSGMRKGNGWDGLWGLQYSNKSAGRQYVRGAVFEYFQSTNQSGPLHWDSGDYPEPIRSQITDLVTGNDNYYNHMFYGSYTHYGMTPGIGLITSPIYNKNGFNEFSNNRVKAWHLGINGEITDHISYLVKGSYQEGWGTYSAPAPQKLHSFDAMFQGIYTTGPWKFSAAYAFDKGNVYGDCNTFNFKIGYHGKIL